MSWFNLLNRNSDCLKEESIVKLVRELNNNLAASGSSDSSLYQNILSSCTEFLSGGKTPSDRHTPLCNSWLLVSLLSIQSLVYQWEPLVWLLTSCSF
jgi:hypothetical protein